MGFRLALIRRAPWGMIFRPCGASMGDFKYPWLVVYGSLCIDRRRPILRGGIDSVPEGRQSRIFRPVGSPGPADYYLDPSVARYPPLHVVHVVQVYTPPAWGLHVP